MVTCSALGFVDPDAPKKDPEWTRALKYGAKAKIELHVVDDDGIPVPNANVIVIMGMISRSYLIEGETNTNGIFVIEGKTKGNSIEIRIEKEDERFWINEIYLNKDKLVLIGTSHIILDPIVEETEEKRNSISARYNSFSSSRCFCLTQMEEV